MDVRLIAAVGKQGQLTFDRKDIPWATDTLINWFKQVTMGGVVVIGYNTSKGMPIMTGRTVCVMERDERPQEVMARYQGRQIWVAGGYSTFREWLPFVATFTIKRVNYEGQSRYFLPALWARRSAEVMPDLVEVRQRVRVLA